MKNNIHPVFIHSCDVYSNHGIESLCDCEAIPYRLLNIGKRLCARIFDYSLLFLATIGLLLWREVALGPFLKGALFPYMILMIVFLWAFIEGVFLSVIGTTPGKCLFRIFIKDIQYQHITLVKGVGRGVSVWWAGIGAGIPFIMCMTSINSALHLYRLSHTQWDQRLLLVVSYKKMSWLNILLIVGYMLGYTKIISMGYTYVIN